MGKLRKLKTGDIGLLSPRQESDRPRPLEQIMERIGIASGSSHRFVDSLPFSLNDTTAGCENELQAAVAGDRQDVDMPVAIERSNFFANIIRRAAVGEAPKTLRTNLEAYLEQNPEGVWENSWVRFPMKVLSGYARQILESDLCADKANPDSSLRADAGRFLLYEGGEKLVRVPISYLLKLALADVLGSQLDAPAAFFETGQKLLQHFLNDNTSPETFSFHPVFRHPQLGLGRAVARETAKRFLLTQFLTMYANAGFGLAQSGQRAIIYSAPHVPVRQRELNECISDAFYRELFMSPCLSGWDRGEEKHSYMGLCHQVLSRSQLNAISKLREAGVVTRNLVVLPNMSNISLANNGTHLSLGSIRLSRSFNGMASGLTRADEKYLGDLVIKIVEHFLPLFVGTYSAAPYRMDFCDFHPERALGFLPHELDYTHLRMLWRRWKKKANLKIFGHPVTPFGPLWLDRMISFFFRLQGDMVPDFRLIDYFVALMSTDRSPALDGRIGNGERLKQDLADLGVFDTKMAVYLLYRLREFDVMGFSGFEGRHYSLFESLSKDLAPAADLQNLLTVLAFKYVAEGSVSHEHIPDIPSVESERRQIFFGASIGIPTFFVRKDTPNLFLKRIVEGCRRVRHSRRYPGYWRVYNIEYRRALAKILLEDAADLIELLDLRQTMQDLQLRLAHPEEYSAVARLTRSIIDEMDVRSPMSVDGREFNSGAERYYRESLRRKYLDEAYFILEEDVSRIEFGSTQHEDGYAKEFHFVLQERSASAFIRALRKDVLDENVSLAELRSLIDLTLLTIHHDIQESQKAIHEASTHETGQTPISRAAHW